MIEATYETSLSQTIEDAQSAADAIDTSAGSDSDSDSEKSGFWSGITSSVQNAVSGVTGKVRKTAQQCHGGTRCADRYLVCAAGARVAVPAVDCENAHRD